MPAGARAARPISALMWCRAAFEGKSRVERHRVINAALAGAFERGLHALAIHAKAPGE